MAKPLTDAHLFQDLERAAYHAFIEWPLVLSRKRAHLKAHIAAASANLKAAEQAPRSASSSTQPS